MKITGDFAQIYNAYEKLTEKPHWRLSYVDILDALDETFKIIDQSIIGDLGTTYKKVVPFAKWIRSSFSSLKSPDWNSYRYEQFFLNLPTYVII